MTHRSEGDSPEQEQPPFTAADESHRTGHESSTDSTHSRESADSSEPDPRRDEATLGTRIYRGVREVVIVVVIALIASSLLRAFVVQAFFVPSTSMLPTIHRGDRILVSRINGIERGEVVVFEDPGGWIMGPEKTSAPGGLRAALEWVGVLPSSSHEHLVKRVIGLPGDHVVCCDAQGRLSINGADVNESSFIAPGPKAADDSKFDVVVPANHIFVLGDNRYESADSAYHLQIGPRNDPNAAFVPEDLVTGRAFSIVWPFSDATWLGIPDAYANVPDGRPAPKIAVIKKPAGFGR